MLNSVSCKNEESDDQSTPFSYGVILRFDWMQIAGIIFRSQRTNGDKMYLNPTENVDLRNDFAREDASSLSDLTFLR